MSRFPHGGEVLGASPAHPLLAPVLRPEMVLSRQQALLDLQAIQRIPGLAGYWPSDPAYAYQDSAGYTPANVGGVVGQVRDISNAATPVARRNLLTYSEDLTVTGVVAGTATIVDAITLATPAPNDGFNSLVVTGAPGSIFTLSAKLSGSGTTVLALRASGGPGAWITQLTVNLTATPTWHSVTGPIPADGVGVVAWVRRLNGTTATQVTIHARQLEIGAEATPYQKIVTGTGDVFAPGNHAYQQTTSKKPILKRTPTSNVYWLNSDADDELTATLGNLGSACTVVKAGAEGVTFTEGVTISSTYNIAPAYGFNGDVAIFNRALSVTEKALLTRYMQRGVPLVNNGSIY